MQFFCILDLQPLDEALKELLARVSKQLEDEHKRKISTLDRAAQLEEESNRLGLMATTQ